MSDLESRPWPPHVAFKGTNGKYLSAQLNEENQYLKFSSTDPLDETARNEIVPSANGTIRIRNNYFGKFWKRNSNWIWANSNITSGNEDVNDSLFMPFKVNDDYSVIALKNLGNQLFCVACSKDEKVDCLSADEPSMTNITHLEVHEVP